VKIPLYKYQVKGVKFCLKRKYVIIGDEQGLGKTVQAIAVMERVGGRCLVICPGMLRINWKKEIEKYTDLTCQAVMTTKEPLDLDADVLITSYESASKVFSKELSPTVVVVDECQYIKNVQAKRSVFLHSLVFQSRPEYFIALSGTPIKNHAGEFFSVLKLCSYSPEVTNGLRVKEKSQFSFSNRFCWREDSHFGTKFSGCRNVNELKEYLKGKYIRRMADKVLELPPIVNKTVNLDLKKSEVIVSQEDLETAYKQYQALGKHGTHLSQIKHDSALQKSAYCLEYTLMLVESGESVVIFTDHRGPLKALVSGFTAKRVAVDYISGGISDTQKQRTVEKFQEGHIKVLVCTFGSAATGFTLTKSRHVVFNDITWVPADLDQARKRIHRIGQVRKCVLHYMVSGSFDEKLTNTVIGKSEVLSKIL
jgi:SNF2 family DNA or RNA helicase